MLKGPIKFAELLKDTTEPLIRQSLVPKRQPSAIRSQRQSRSFKSFAGALWTLSASSLVGIAVASIFVEASSLPLVGDMLSRPHLIDRTAPILILLLFAWVVTQLLLKAWQVRREHSATDTFQLHLALGESEQYRPNAFDLRQTRATRRADLITECSRADPSSLHEAVPAAAALDSGMLAGSYGPLHVYAWILPVLGFIGTASGMASSINGFKDALRGGQGQVEALSNQLAQTVIPGLSAAFETTILALAASVVTYLCTNASRIWDQEALNELDGFCILLLSRIPEPEGPDSKKVVARLEYISDQLRDTLQVSFVNENEQLSKMLEAAPGLERAADAIKAAAEALAAASKELRDTATAPYHVTITRGEHP
jgi:biopolymer transport protein ExbB/TolQ